MQYVALILAVVWLNATCEAQTPKIQKQVQKKLDKARADQKNDSIWIDLAAGPGSTLDQLIAEAMKNNPDIRVADAKQREAEAELARARLKVAIEIAALHAEIESARAAVKEAEKRYGRIKALVAQGNVFSKELDGARLTVETLKRELAVKEAKLPYLLGRPIKTAAALLINDLIAKKTLDIHNDPNVTDDEFLRRVTLDLLGRLPTVAETQKFMDLPDKTRRQQWLEQLTDAKYREAADRGMAWLARVQMIQVDAPLSDKLKKALATPIKLQTADSTQDEVLQHVRHHLPGVNLHVRVKAAKKGIHIVVTEPIPMAAFLQLVEDELGVAFVLRDYGIVVVANDEPLPPGAVRVVDWWKQGTHRPAK